MRVKFFFPIDQSGLREFAVELACRSPKCRMCSAGRISRLIVVEELRRANPVNKRKVLSVLLGMAFRPISPIREPPVKREILCDFLRSLRAAFLALESGRVGSDHVATRGLRRSAHGPMSFGKRSGRNLGANSLSFQERECKHRSASSPRSSLRYEKVSVDSLYDVRVRRHPQNVERLLSGRRLPLWIRPQHASASKSLPSGETEKERNRNPEAMARFAPSGCR